MQKFYLGTFIYLYAFFNYIQYFCFIPRELSIFLKYKLYQFST